jgi:hypothetical protein
MTEDQAQVRQVLVYVGDAGRVDVAREQFVNAWVTGGREAIAVLPAGANPDRALPAAIRGLHAAFWGATIDEAVIDVLAVAGVVGADQRMFISYSHADGIALAHAVLKAATEARFDAFLDSASLVPGTAFAERIEHRLADAAFVVLVETPRSVGSVWVQRELAFARRVRAEIAAIGEAGAPRAHGQGITDERRIRLKPGELHADRLAAPAERRVVAKLRALHAGAMTRRRAVLERSLRVELQRRGVAGADITRGAGMLGVRAGAEEYAVALQPRPAGLADMHRAHARCPSRARPVVLSSSPWGGEERRALEWLAGGPGPAHADEAKIGRLVSRMIAGSL